MNNKPKIAVADSHAEYCETLSALLTESGFEIVLSVPADPALLWLMDAGNPPDLIIISCSTLYPESIGLIMELKKNFPTIKILASVAFLHFLPNVKSLGDTLDGVIVKTAAELTGIIAAIHAACGRS